MRTILMATAALALALPATAQTRQAMPSLEPVPVAQLLQGVDIPYESFTLDNGLTVLVHTDRKAPIVAVASWFNVGSKDEQAGKTGFAHLFEHIMLFNGTEHIPNLVVPLRDMGATDWNGTTWFDRTNYFETVPTPALERALYIESERMGYLLGALTQERLDAQRGVVQNEKRQGDNNPYGLVQYAELEALFPEGHPYRHTTIGAMADLDSASLEDVRQWFRDNYGPNNAVLVLTGDIDVATARPLVQRYFGAIPRGPRNDPAEAAIPTLAAPVSLTMHDRVANTRLYREWVVPGLADADTNRLDIAASVLGGLASSRLDTALVRGNQSAVSVSSGVQTHQRVSLFRVSVDVKPGQDVDAVGRQLDQIIADFVRTGPTADEVRRVATLNIVGGINSVEQIGGFSGQTVALAEGAVLAGDARFFRRNLETYASTTPADVTAAMQRWLTRPVLSIRVDPGAREDYQQADATGHPAPDTSPPTSQPRDPMPAMGQIADLDFPAVERARLSNGIEVVYAHRDAVPVTLASVEFDAGNAADPADALGTQTLMLRSMATATTHLDALHLAETLERLGAGIGANANQDRTAVTLQAVTANLDPSLAVLADIVRNPAFAPEEVERLRNQQLAGIAQEMTQPVSIGARAIAPILYGPGHPYGRPASGLGDAAVVQALTRDNLTAFHQRWIRPDNARIFVVSNLPLSQITAKLEAQFGDWRAPAAARGHKNFDAAIPAPQPRIILIDRPQSPQSVIYAGQILPVTGRDDTVTLNAANEVLGNNFLSRINTDIRERKGWSYGLFGRVILAEHQVPYYIQAPVQSDRTGQSIAALMADFQAFAGAEGVTEAERERTVNGNIRQLPGSFETGAAVLGAMRSNALYGRPDDYWERLPGRYRAMTAAEMDAAARRSIDVSRMVWVVVGDAATVRPQLEGLGLPVEVRSAAPATH